MLPDGTAGEGLLRTLHELSAPSLESMCSLLVHLDFPRESRIDRSLGTLEVIAGDSHWHYGWSHARAPLPPLTSVLLMEKTYVCVIAGAFLKATSPQAIQW